MLHPEIDKGADQEQWYDFKRRGVDSHRHMGYEATKAASCYTLIAVFNPCFDWPNLERLSPTLANGTEANPNTINEPGDILWLVL